MGDTQCFGGCRGGNEIWFWLAILVLIWVHYDSGYGAGFGKW